ncbi:hypothetical protein [Spirochaeta dissipatitropha]
MQQVSALRSARLREPVERIHCLAAMLLLVLLLPLSAVAQNQAAPGIQVYEPILVDEYGYRMDPPSGWYLSDASDMRLLTFSSPDGSAVVQILVYTDLNFVNADQMLVELSAQLRAEVLASERFMYAGRESVLADMEFAAGSEEVRGYAILIDDPVYPMAILGYARQETYEVYHDFLLSFMDSVSLDGGGDGLPGPVSQYLVPFQPGRRGLGDDAELIELNLAGQSAGFWYDPDQTDASQVLIDREARLLTAYAGDSAPRELQEIAWERFFRMIYRDSYARVSPLADLWRSVARSQEIERERLPAVILSWLQGFDYDRPGGISDFLNPLDTVYLSEGDCDSLVLLYAMILDQLGFDSIIMVSTVHGHALAGVDVEGSGARFPFGGRNWLVAELTAPVDLGLIDATMADPADWMGFIFQRIY